MLYQYNFVHTLHHFIIGDLTERGYQRKKLKLRNEIDDFAKVGSDEKTRPQQFSSVAKDDQMAETLIKLFKKPHPVSPSTLPKAKGKSSSKRPSLKLITKVIETVMVPRQTSSIPRGDTRQQLHKKGYVKMLQFLKSDMEPSFRERVYQLFKHILSSPDDFQFLSAKSKSLVTVNPDVFGHSSEAIVTLAGQGSLYLLPRSVQEVIKV